MRLILVLVLCEAMSAAVIADIRLKLSAGDLLSADALAEEFCKAQPGSSECAAAWSWMARGAHTMGRNEEAKGYLESAKKVIAGQPKADAFLQTAIGAVIETEARVMEASGKKAEAIAMLKREVAQPREYAVQARIQKTLNVMTLVGQRAPHWDAAWKGKTTLLFLWAHWCGDCKAQVAAIAEVRAKFGDRLHVVAPTKLYGTVPDEEAHIEKVWKEAYGALEGVAHPVDAKMMLDYGVSSTPTLVVIDGSGKVTGYFTSRMSAEKIARRLEFNRR
jgi:thiol-disulfide isomerase/thioredoxin